MNNLPLWDYACENAVTDEFKLAYDICAKKHKNERHSVLANPRRMDKQKQIKRIVEALRRIGDATCQELEVILDLPHESCSARCADMKRLGLIELCGERLTRSGRKAGVYRLTIDDPGNISRAS